MSKAGGRFFKSLALTGAIKGSLRLVATGRYAIEMSRLASLETVGASVSAHQLGLIVEKSSEGKIKI
jgi:hypothetical protein